MNHYYKLHSEAMAFPKGFERPIVELLYSWRDYARQHAGRYASGIGEDGVLGEEWAAIGRALLGLLNGETGRLDCATLDATIRDQLTAEGFDGDAS